MNEFSEYKDSATRIGKIAIENVKLRLTDSLVQLFSGIVIGATVTIITAIAIFFFSAGVAFRLSEEMDPIWAFGIVGLFYLILLLLIYILRKKIIYNTVTRMLSRIILKNPNTQTEEEKKNEYYDEKKQCPADS